MSVFKTQRPESIEVALNRAVELKILRRNNRAAILESAKLDEESKETKKMLDKQDAEDEKKAATESALSNIRTRRSEQIKNLSKVKIQKELLESAVNETYNQVLFEIVYESFWQDDEVKENSDILAMYETFNDVKNMVNEMYELQDTQMLQNIRNAVTEACKKATERIINELDESDDLPLDSKTINFSLNDSEDAELEDNLSELGKDEIADLVKAKVLTVIQDEQRAAQQKAEIFQEMDEKMAELKAEKDDTATPEGEGDTGEETTPTDTEGATKESVSIAERNMNNRLKKSVNSTLFEALMMNSNKTLRETAVSEGLNVNEDSFATAVFTDSVYRYTILETLNTLGMYKFNQTNIAPLIRKVSEM